MIVSKVRLSWFRGAAESAELLTANRSSVVFGANGAGKSCFVDAIEYTLSGGRIKHLAHEYSGRHQEKAVLNTHRPADGDVAIEIELSDGTKVRVEISEAGVPSLARDGDTPFEDLDCARTVLRQDEVSEFIHSTKGEKYSVLLPLLGLAHLETAAENFRQLGRAVRKRSGAAEAAGALRSAKGQLARLVNGDSSTAEDVISALCAAYVEEEHEHSPDACAALVEVRLRERLRDSSALTLRQDALRRLGSLDFRGAVSQFREAASSLAKVADHATRARLDVLRETKGFLARSEHPDPVECPACGSAIPLPKLQEHVERELSGLEEAEQLSTSFRSANVNLRSSASAVVGACRGQEIQSWAAEAEDERISEAIDAATKFGPLSEDLPNHEVQKATDVLGLAISFAAAAGSFLPAPAADLATAQERLQAGVSVLSADKQVAESRTAEQLADRVVVIEAELRREINEKSRQVIAEISTDIQRFWQILHPGEPIENVRLHVPEDSDKAIDITLKFYGKELESPRLTLSEGYRNSLGLCIFLAMAAKYGEGDTPIVLDDVIVSLDRGHRGMVADLLQQEFAERQIVLFTHDRDWFTDLRQQLGAAEWKFQELRPYASPEQGIRWAHRAGSLSDARAYLESRPDTAASEARKVMDVELAIHCERLEISLPFARGARNDRRGAHEFLQGLIRAARTFQRRKDSGYEVNETAVAAFETARELLVTWGNRGSHSSDVTRPEAERLIDACESALGALTCAGCRRPVHRLENSRNRMRQCECGDLRWKR